ncbi:MAG: hypothetical protein ABIX01_17970, partial [Chitinophagaceae bacterium]
MMNGNGKRSIGNEYFEGQYMNNQKVNGSYHYKDGSLYTGEWYNNEADGLGENTANGVISEGTFVQGLFTGTGTVTLDDGDKYVSDYWHGNGFIRGTYYKQGKGEGVVGRYSHQIFTPLRKVENEAEDKLDKYTRAWIKECNKAIKKGDLDSLASLGRFYSRVDGLRHRGIDLLRQGEMMGNANSIFELGRLYDYEWYGLLDSALKYYERAAALGSVEATYRMGIIYDRGNLKNAKGEFTNYSHVVRNPDKAKEQFKKGAEKFYIPSLNELEYLIDEDNGGAYMKGATLNNQKKYQEAMPWLEAAANYRISQACFLLGQIYYLGSGGVPVNNEESTKWFIKQGDLGNPEGYYRAGLSLSVAKQYDRAFSLYEKAIAMGSREAATSLASAKSQIKQDAYNEWAVRELEKKRAAGIDIYGNGGGGNNTVTSANKPVSKTWCSECHGSGKIARIEYYTDKMSGLQSGRTVYDNCGRCYGKGYY